MLLEQIVAHQVDLVLPITSTFLVLPGLEIMAPFWDIFVVPAHLIPSLALERFLV
jgi:hypothetical protein